MIQVKDLEPGDLFALDKKSIPGSPHEDTGLWILMYLRTTYLKHDFLPAHHFIIMRCGYESDYFKPGDHWKTRQLASIPDFEKIT